MALGVALLVIVSAMMHASWNAMLKRSRDPEHLVVSMSAACAISSCALALALHTRWPPRMALLWIVGSGLLEAGYFLTLARALSLAPLGAVYTVVRGGALLIVWPVSILLLHEELTPLRGIGTALVLGGLATQYAKAMGRGIAIAAVCACFVGGYHLCYKLALSNGGSAEAVSSISISLASVLVFATAGREKRTKAITVARVELVRTLVGGALGAVGFLLFLAGMERAGAGTVTTLRNTSILFAQILAFLLGERPKRLGILGAVLVFAGAALLAR